MSPGLVPDRDTHAPMTTETKEPARINIRQHLLQFANLNRPEGVKELDMAKLSIHFLNAVLTTNALPTVSKAADAWKAVIKLLQPCATTDKNLFDDKTSAMLRACMKLGFVYS